VEARRLDMEAGESIREMIQEGGRLPCGGARRSPARRAEVPQHSEQVFLKALGMGQARTESPMSSSEEEFVDQGSKEAGEPRGGNRHVEIRQAEGRITIESWKK
jgi:hypothetical protein